MSAGPFSGRRALGWLWRELTRPRGPGAHRLRRSGRGRRSGVALLLVIANIMFLTVLVTEVSYAATVRLKLAGHSRDEVKAEALATSGVQIYHLLLVGSKALGKQGQALLQMLPEEMRPAGLNGDTLWQFLPFINTEMMRGFAGGASVDAEDLAAIEQDGLSEEQIAKSREGSGNKRGFLDFDGDFMAEVVDEDRRIDVRRIGGTNMQELQADPVAQQLFGLMSGVTQCNGNGLDIDRERDDNDQFFYDIGIERWELISNLADWVDPDDRRIWLGGSEDGLYQNLPDPYRPKQAPFDTLAEIRLVDGWHRDDVWERYGELITAAGSGKVNVNTADCRVIEALLRTHAVPNDPASIQRYLQAIELARAFGPFANPRAFVAAVQSGGATDTGRMAQQIATEGSVYRVSSTGTVGDATVSIEMIIDFSQSNLGRVQYWRTR